jgi:hypothetical protein
VCNTCNLFLFFLFCLSISFVLFYKSFVLLLQTDLQYSVGVLEKGKVYTSDWSTSAAMGGICCRDVRFCILYVRNFLLSLACRWQMYG